MLLSMKGPVGGWYAFFPHILIQCSTSVSLQRTTITTWMDSLVPIPPFSATKLTAERMVWYVCLLYCTWERCFCISSNWSKVMSVLCSTSLPVQLVEISVVIRGELAAEECSSIVVVMRPLISLIKSQSSVRVVQLVHSKDISHDFGHSMSAPMRLACTLLNTWPSWQSD